jgi:hypothetical protein
MMPGRTIRLLTLGSAILLAASTAAASDRYALIVSGASGGPQFAQRYDAWRDALITLLRDTFGYPADHMQVLSDSPSPGTRRSTRENVRAALDLLHQQTKADDVVLVILIGHGSTGEAEESKFNLLGPDLSAREWADLVKPIAGRIVFVDTSGGSFPFMKALAAPGRIVLTATDSPGQVFETVFAEYFIKALGEPAADADKNQKVSIQEAFDYASAGVKGWFAEQGQLATERPAIDDTGHGVNEESAPRARSLASITYLQPDVRIPATADAELAGLLRRRAELEATVERLRLNKPNLPQEQYERELESLLLEMARVDRQIRSKSENPGPG